MNIREYLKENRLLFDGAMGTYCAEKIPESIGSDCELLNLSAPNKIAEIHEEYIEAGARAIKTNTFAANRLGFDEESCRKIIEAGFGIANKYSNEAFVFADIGPIAVTDNENLVEEYRFVVDLFLEAGAENFLFETNSNIEGLLEIADYIKSKKTEAFILLSFSTQTDGFTRSGQQVSKLLSEAEESESVDAIGLNCTIGAWHMSQLINSMKLPDKCFSAMPNAGYPTVLGSRAYYNGSPEFFAGQLQRIAKKVRILGGCCGTTPKHIAAAASALRMKNFREVRTRTESVRKSAYRSKLMEELFDEKKRPIAVELDPPTNSDLAKFIRAAKEIKEKGASAITIADCPVGRARMDSSILACRLKRELNMDILPHMTCRDRNMNALKALLLGLCAEKVHNVLIVTGDPIPTAERDEVKSVYNFNSRMLAGYITALAETSLATPFNIFAALNINAVNFQVQLRIAKEKEKNGVCAFLTQPVLTKEAFENLKLAKAELKGKILGGIFPIVSHKNAMFMNSEVAGVRISDEIISLYEGKTREEAEELAYKISCDIAEKLYPYVDGYYLMTPFSRTKLIGRIMDRIKAL